MGPFHKFKGPKFKRQFWGFKGHHGATLKVSNYEATATEPGRNKKLTRSHDELRP